MVTKKSKYDWKITLIKALKVAGAGAVTSLLGWLTLMKDSDPVDGVIISIALALLTAAQNWLKHKND